MKQGMDGLKNGSLHVLLIAALFAAVLLPSRSLWKTPSARGAGHHHGHCRACSFGLPPELLRDRDAALVRAGCIDPWDAEE